MTKRCIELVKAFEGFSAEPYICPAGYPTVGYGHVIIPEEKEKFNQHPLSKEEAEELLIDDLMRVELGIRPLIEVSIHPYMLDALVSFTYNCGIFAFRASTLRRKLNRKEFKEAADQFLKWVYAGGKKLKGLVRRREAEKELFLEGVELLERG